MKKLNKKYILVAFVIIILIITFFISSKNNIESTDNAYINSDITIVAPQISGKVVEVFIAENQKVTEGMPLIKIEDIAYKSINNEARLAVESQKIVISMAEYQLSLKDFAAKKIEALIVSKKANLERDQNELARASKLSKDEFGSKKFYDASNASFVNSKSDLDSTNLDYEVAKIQVLLAKEQLLLEKYKLESLQSKLAVAEYNLENTLIKAPKAGYIGNKSVEVGDFLQPGRAIFSLIPLDPYITANFKETQTARMTIGQKVSVKIDAFPTLKFEGIIDSIAPASGAVFSLLPPENATGNFTKIIQRVPVKIKLIKNNHDKILQTGLSAVVKVKINDILGENDDK